MTPLLALATLLAAAPSVAVLEFQTRLEPGDKVDRVYLSERVRKFVKLQLPQAMLIDRENVEVLLQAQGKTLAECEGECEVETGKKLGADLVISGQILRFGASWKLALKLHDTHTSQRLSTEQASGKTLEELDANIEPAVVALMAPVAVAGGPALAAVPEVKRPDALQAPPPALDLDADLLVAYDKALTADKAGAAEPAGAAQAWAELFSYGGKNPYKDLAEKRAAEWRKFAAAKIERERAERKSAADLAARRADDKKKLLKILPLASFAWEQKLQLLDQHAQRYGHADDAELAGALPADQQDKLCARDADKPWAMAKLKVLARQPEFDVVTSGCCQAWLGDKQLDNYKPTDVSACSKAKLVVELPGFKKQELPYRLRRGQLSEVKVDLPAEFQVAADAIVHLETGLALSRRLGQPVNWDRAQSACGNGWHLFGSRKGADGGYETNALYGLPREAYEKVWPQIASEEAFWIGRDGANGMTGTTMAMQPGSTTSEYPPDKLLRPLCARQTGPRR